MITNSFPVTSTTSRDSSYSLTGSGSLTLEAGTYYILMVGGGSGGAHIKYGSSLNLNTSVGGGAGGCIKGLINITEKTTLSYSVGKGSTQLIGIASYSYSMAYSRLTDAGGNTSITLKGVTMTAYGGTGAGLDTENSHVKGVGGSTTISSNGEYYLTTANGMSGEGSGVYSYTVRGEYVGGVEYNGVLYGAGGAADDTSSSQPKRDGTDGCLIIVKT